MLTVTSKKIVSFTFVIFLALITISNPQAGSLDPLTNQEIEKASELMLAGTQSDSQAAQSEQSESTSQIETLLIERHAVAKGAENQAARLVDVFTYNYDTNILNQTIINLSTNSVVSTTHNKEVQLPLTENEITRATEVVFGDQDEVDLINQAYQRVTGETLTQPDQLEIKAFTFLGNSLPGVSNEESMNCGNHRCAQLLLYTPEKVAFEISPVIDLSTKKVIQNINF